MNASIEIYSENGVTSTLKLNGVDISEQVSSIQFTHHGGKLTEVQLTFLADTVSIQSLCNVQFPNAVFQALSKKQREELLEDK